MRTETYKIPKLLWTGRDEIPELGARHQILDGNVDSDTLSGMLKTVIDQIMDAYMQYGMKALQLSWVAYSEKEMHEKTYQG